MSGQALTMVWGITKCPNQAIVIFKKFTQKGAKHQATAGPSENK